MLWSVRSVEWHPQTTPFFGSWLTVSTNCFQLTAHLPAGYLLSVSTLISHSFVCLLWCVSQGGRCLVGSPVVFLTEFNFLFTFRKLWLLSMVTWFTSCVQPFRFRFQLINLASLRVQFYHQLPLQSDGFDARTVTSEDKWYLPLPPVSFWRTAAAATSANFTLSDTNSFIFFLLLLPSQLLPSH